MDFDKLFPLVDPSGKYNFKDCINLKEFLQKCIDIYFSTLSLEDERLRNSCLAVYMAFRDHYPEYMEYLKQEQKEKLDLVLTEVPPKVIKLRRIVIGSLAKALKEVA